ncbi:MAG: DedA family protein [Bacillota bacterium]|jgi:membrane protein DedA with SNARE-associated domain|nr:DedA family protein [Thermoanaerobacteraceae bacterium]
MLEKVINAVTEYIAALGYWGIAIGMAIESCNIPLPSEVILPFGGFLAAQGKLNFFLAALAGNVGGTVGSIVSYYLGFKGGRPFLERYGRYFWISQRELAFADRWFARWGEATVFFTRMLPVIRTFISFPAGVARMNFKRFVFYTFFGSLPWSFLLTYLGFKLGQHWEILQGWFHRFDAAIVVLLLLLVVLAFWWHRR